MLARGPGIYKIRSGAADPAESTRMRDAAYERGNSVRILFDRHAVVHLIDAKNLCFTTVTSELVVLAHDQRLDRLRRAHFRAQPAEAATREVEVEVVEDFDLRPRLAVAAERDEIVRTRFRALIADDAGLRARARLGLEAQHAAEARRGRPPLGRVLEGERRLRRVLQRDPQPLRDVDEEQRLDEAEDGAHHARSPTMMGSEPPSGMTRSLRRTVPSLRILSCRRISP